MQFDRDRLKADLALVQAQEWLPHYNANDYQGDWDVAALRSVLGSPDIIYSSNLVDIIQDTPLLNRCRYLREVIDTFQCDKTAVRFMRLGPGSG